MSETEKVSQMKQSLILTKLYSTKFSLILNTCKLRSYIYLSLAENLEWYICMNWELKLLKNMTLEWTVNPSWKCMTVIALAQIKMKATRVSISFTSRQLMSYLQYLTLLCNDLHLTLNLNMYCNIPVMHTE